MGGYHNKTTARDSFPCDESGADDCPVNYEDPTEEEAMKTKRTQPISALKMVTWKSYVTSPFKTPQECVGQNGNRKGKLMMDRQLRNSCHVSKVTRGTMGRARLVSARGAVGVSRGKRPKQ